MPSGSEEHHDQLLAPVGLEDGLVLVGPGPGEVGLGLGEVGLGLGDVRSGLGEVGLELGEAGRGVGELGLCFGLGLCRCQCLGAGCLDLCLRAAST